MFLYHPCAPKDQVAALRRLARSCLWRHIITSYPHLTQDKVCDASTLIVWCMNIYVHCCLHFPFVASGFSYMGMCLSDVMGGC